MYAALPFELHLRCLKAEAAGLEPATNGLRTMYSNRQSVMYCLATKLWPEILLRTGIEPADRIAISRLTGRSHVFQPVIAVCFKKAQRSFAKRSRSRYGRLCQQTVLPTVDWPFHLGETPAPFTIRSPGIATLGPSCTPGRQLD
jgi:hypothetical protein